ncbi:MAG: sugar-binding protein, partial [Verrucomicrobiota bacterium]
ASPWKGNCLELFFEKDFARAPHRSSNAVQWALAPGESEGACVIWPEEIKADVQATWKRTPTGYTIEFFIPAKLLAPFVLKPGAILGFNYCLSDHDGKPAEEYFCSKAWGGFAIPALWGAIALADDPSTKTQH